MPDICSRRSRSMSGYLVSKRASSSSHYLPHHCSLLATRLDSHLLPSRDSKCSSSHPWTHSITAPAPPTCFCPCNRSRQRLEKLKPPVSTLAITPDNDHMEVLKPGGVRHQDTSPVTTIFGASVEGDNSGGGNGGGNDASIRDNRGASKPKKRAVPAEWYTFTFRGMNYHIRMHSSLGETYRNLATKAEQREFAMEHGEPEPVVGRRVRAAR